jgi:hypothetical protein
VTAEPVHLPNATPFDLIADHLEDLIAEARNFADGEPVTNQGQADAVSALIESLRIAAKDADAERVRENKPHDDAKAAVQARYNVWIAPSTNKVPGKVFKAIDALKACLQPYLAKLDAEKREAERVAREIADKAARDAAEAMRAAAACDIGAKEQAEALVADAEAAQKAAQAAAKDKAHATGGSRAMGLRSVWKATVTDAQAAAAHYWRTNPDAFAGLLQKLADDDVRCGKRSGIPGVEIVEERVL